MIREINRQLRCDLFRSVTAKERLDMVFYRRSVFCDGRFLDPRFAEKKPFAAIIIKQLF